MFTVNSDGDQADSSPGDGYCRTGTSATNCTLRAAIEEANAMGGSPLISFNLPSGHETIYVTSQLPQITGKVVIDGTTQPGYDGDMPVVRVNGMNVIASIDGLRSSSSSDVGVKAVEILKFTHDGVHANGKLTMDHSFISANQNIGISSSSSSLTSDVSSITYSKIAGNGGTGPYSSGLYIFRRSFLLEHTTVNHTSGPGITSMEGNLTLNDTSVMNNEATSAGFVYGGGIYFESIGLLTITASTIEANTAMDGSAWAGGIAINGGSVNITDSVITGNQGFASGGIYIHGGTVHLNGCTLTQNVGWHAGGIFLSDAAGGELWVENGTHIGKPGEGNTASIYSEGYRYGGGIFNQRNVHISDSSIGDNSGVGIQSEFSGASGSVEISHSHIDSNTLGGIYALNTNLTFNDGSVWNNGGIGIAMKEGSLLLQIANVKDNSSLGLQLLDADLQMMDSIVSRNIDGGIAVASLEAAVPVNAQIQDSQILDNGRAGISAEFANLVINGTIIQGNMFSGIVTDSVQLNLTNSTLSDNQTPKEGGGIYGAKIIAAVIKNSTISGNTAADSGGGAFFTGWPTTTVLILDSTISGNQAGTKGGGIAATGGSIELNNVTITDNTASSGGGIFNQTVFAVANSIVAKNGGANCDPLTPLVSNGHNLDDGTSCGFSSMGDISNVPAILGLLQDNGGDTFTHALLPGSPALEAGDDATCLPVDQRGISRPQGLHCDMGAYEAENPATATPPTVTNTLTPTLTPSPAAILFDPVNFSTKIIYASGRSCDPKEMTIQVKVTPEEFVHSVGLFFRLEEKNGTKVGPWSEGLAMIPKGGGWYELTLYGENLIGNFQSQDEIWVAIQFVANGKDGRVLAHSPVYRQVTLGKCYQ